MPRLYCSFMAPHSAPRGVLSMAHTSSQTAAGGCSRSPRAVLGTRGRVDLRVHHAMPAALRVHFAHGRVLIWRHCLLHGHVKTPFLHGALCKALHMGPPAAGAVLAFQLAWTTAVLLLAAGSSFEAEQAGPRCKACGLHVLDWRRSAARTAARIRLAHCARP